MNIYFVSCIKNLLCHDWSSDITIDLNILHTFHFPSPRILPSQISLNLFRSSKQTFLLIKLTTCVMSTKLAMSSKEIIWLLTTKMSRTPLIHSVESFSFYRFNEFCLQSTKIHETPSLIHDYLITILWVLHHMIFQFPSSLFFIIIISSYKRHISDSRQNLLPLSLIIELININA